MVVIRGGTIGLVNQVCINMKKNMTTQARAAVCHFICCLNRLTSVTSINQRNPRILNGPTESDSRIWRIAVLLSADFETGKFIKILIHYI